MEKICWRLVDSFLQGLIDNFNYFNACFYVLSCFVTSLYRILWQMVILTRKMSFICKLMKFVAVLNTYNFIYNIGIA